MSNKGEEDNDFLIKKDENLDFNELLEKMGYQSIHYKIMMCCFLLTAIEGSSFTLMSAYIIALEQYFLYDKLMILILSSVIFIGVGIGSFSIGLLEPYISRVNMIKYNILSYFVFSILLIFCSNIYLFTIVRFLSGYNIGVFIPIIMNMLCEYLPLKFRSFSMIVVWSGFQLGAIFNFLVALILMKNFEPEKIPYVLLTVCILNILMGLPCLFLVSETYRNLIVNDREEEGFIILKDMLQKIDVELTEELKSKILKSIKTADNKEFTSKFKSLFSKKHLYITIISSFIFAGCSALFYGPTLIITKTLKDMNIASDENIILSGILIAIISNVFLVLVGLISENEYIGLKTISLFLYIIGWLFSLSIVIWTNQIQYLLISYISITSAAFNATTTMISYTYPTIIRDLALGYLYSCLRFGAFISQLIFLGTYELGIKVPYIILCLLTSGLIFLIFLIKTDTTKIPLDHSFEIEHKMENVNEIEFEIENEENEKKICEKSLNKTS